MNPMNFRTLYRALAAERAPVDWWPARTRFEIPVGAILTQNTRWENVELALSRLRTAACLTPVRLRDMSMEALGELIRPAGFFRMKASYLKAMCDWYLAYDAVAVQMDTATLRRSLLSVRGIGPETADDILLYHYDRSVFIYDAYARRLLTACGCRADGSYESLRIHHAAGWSAARLTADEAARLHAEIVMTGKRSAACEVAKQYFEQIKRTDG
ncbi:MAG: endonuclease [Eubacteriales bacterium]|nr:endonuclease [Eubacteriales bacterium]